MRPEVRPVWKGLKRLDLISLFPGMLEGPLSQSLIGKARERGLIEVRVHNLRDFSRDEKHHKVDDRPFGGGPGMVIQAEPLYQAIRAVRREGPKRVRPTVIFLSPQGQTFDQAKAAQLSRKPWLILVCGHYEGVDERALALMDEEISVGDVVLTGGEIPALVIADATIRLIPGVVKEAASIARDSFQDGLLDHPHYTRPADWRGKKVPAPLLSGDHAAIERWRQAQAVAATRKKRPDLFKKWKAREIVS